MGQTGHGMSVAHGEILSFHDARPSWGRGDLGNGGIHALAASRGAWPCLSGPGTRSERGGGPAGFFTLQGSSSPHPTSPAWRRGARGSAMTRRPRDVRSSAVQGTPGPRPSGPYGPRLDLSPAHGGPCSPSTRARPRFGVSCCCCASNCTLRLPELLGSPNRPTPSWGTLVLPASQLGPSAQRRGPVSAPSNWTLLPPRFLPCPERPAVARAGLPVSRTAPSPGHFTPHPQPKAKSGGSDEPCAQLEAARPGPVRNGPSSPRRSRSRATAVHGRDG